MTISLNANHRGGGDRRAGVPSAVAGGGGGVCAAVGGGRGVGLFRGPAAVSRLLLCAAALGDGMARVYFQEMSSLAQSIQFNQ